MPDEATHVAFGILLEGKGQVWLSTARFEEVSLDVPSTSFDTSLEYSDQPSNLDFAETIA